MPKILSELQGNQNSRCCIKLLLASCLTKLTFNLQSHVSLDEVIRSRISQNPLLEMLVVLKTLFEKFCRAVGE